MKPCVRLSCMLHQVITDASNEGTYFIVLLKAGQVASDCPLMGHSTESGFLRNAEHPLSENQSFRKCDLWNCVPR